MSSPTNMSPPLEVNLGHLECIPLPPPLYVGVATAEIVQVMEVLIGHFNK